MADQGTSKFSFSVETEFSGLYHMLAGTHRIIPPGTGKQVEAGALRLNHFNKILEQIDLH